MVYIDIIASISLFILVAFLMWKAVCQWNKPGRFWQFWQWEKRRLMYIRAWKDWIKETPEDSWEWLKNLSGLKKLYFIIAIIISSIFLYSFRFIFPEFIAKIDNDDTSFYNLSLAVFAILSGFGAVFGFYTSIIRTETAEQGLVTDRINKAVEGLGKSTDNGEPIIEVRIGALYALERIAKDSLRDHVQIIEILCAYIHHNSPFSSKLKNPRKDMQVAVTIIGRRAKWSNGKKRIRKEKQIHSYYRIELKKCDLRSADIAHGYMRSVQFNESNMERIIFNSANASWASFENTNLHEAEFRYANLERARFNYANLQNAELYSTNLQKVTFNNANLTTAKFYSANMSEAQFSDVNANSTRFDHANISKASITGGSMIRAQFSEANLTNASIHSVDLSDARLSASNLTNATIGYVNLSGACLERAILDGTKFNNTKMEGVFAKIGDFSTCSTLTQDHLEQMFCGIELIIPDNLTRPEHWPTDILDYIEFGEAYNQWVEKIYPNLPKLPK